MILSRSLVCAPALTAGLAWASAGADTLVTASFDTDSYVFFGTNSAASTEMTLGQDISSSGQYHFNFGVIEFDDLGTAAAGGPTFLELEVEAFSVTRIVGGGPVTAFSATGNATVKLVTLEADFADYLAAASKPDWYDANVGAKDALATATLTSAGLFQLDVTSAVDAWLADGSSNHGLALVVSSGDGLELGATEGGNGAVLTNVPEPGAAAILGLGALFMLRRRR